MKKNTTKLKKWKVLSQEMVFKKYGRGIEKVVYKLPSGKKSDFYLKAESIPAGILALTKKKQVILVKQYRPGPDKILLELPGGAVEKNERPIEAAKRELLEETGYKGKLKLVTRCYDCAYSTINRYCFVATECKKVGKPSLDDTEFAEVKLLGLTEFRKLLRSGKMTDVEVGYLGLDYLSLL
ncbi:MAG: NUDIX hydrolase [Patescibacteria group bacterium]